MKRNFMAMVKERWTEHNTLVCVGLDTELSKIPAHLKTGAEPPIYVFNTSIVAATADLVCAYKPQVAYYSAEPILARAEQQLVDTIDFIHQCYPEIPVILDAKRNDIGSTAKKYAQEVFEKYGADAVTINPYLGYDAVEPFLEYKDKGIVILCRTSNPGAHDFQDLWLTGAGVKFLYEYIAKTVIEKWNRNGNCLLVMGGVRTDDAYAYDAMTSVRAMSDIPFLVPGIGAQGGDVEITVRAGKDSQGAGMIINSSRGIIYASSGEDFAEAARKATEGLRDEINQYR